MTMVNNWTSGTGTLVGKQHELFTGRYGYTFATPEGDKAPWMGAPLGSLHMYQGIQGGAIYQKIKDDNVDGDWIVMMGWVAAKIDYADFVDDETTGGSFTFTDTIPAGATVVHTMIRDVVAFSGDTSAVLTVGDGTDVDRYCLDSATVDVVTGSTGPVLDADTVMDGLKYHIAAKSPVVTVTAGSEWGDVNPLASVTVAIFYIL